MSNVVALGDPWPPQNNYWIPYSPPIYQPTIVTYPVTLPPVGLLNQSAYDERKKIEGLIGEDAVKTLVEAGYEIIRK